MLKLLLSVVLGAASSLAVAAAEPERHLIVKPCDFGEGFQFETKDCVLELENPNAHAVDVVDIRAQREGDSISPVGITIPANGLAQLHARVGLRNMEGINRFHFSILAKQTADVPRTLEVRGYVHSVLDQSKPLLDFGTSVAEDLKATQSIELTSREVQGFRITGVSSSPEWLDVTIGKDGRTVQARLNAKVPLGILPKSHVEVTLNSPVQPRAWIEVKGRVLGDVVPTGDPHDLGLLRTNNVNEALLRLTSRSGKDFRIRKIEVERIGATAQVADCVPAQKGCQFIKLVIDNAQRRGQIGGVLNVDIEGAKKVLPIQVWGMLLSPEVEIVDVEDEQKKNGGATSSSVAPSVNLKAALQAATRPADVPEPAPPGEGPLLKWSVMHEDVIHGYAIYRSESENGPFVRINPQLVPSKKRADSASSYQWRDTSGKRGDVYWYYVGILNNDGTKEALTQPQRVVFK